jgi:hypothetical protein
MNGQPRRSQRLSWPNPSHGLSDRVKLRRLLNESLLSGNHLEPNLKVKLMSLDLVKSLGGANPISTCARNYLIRTDV